MKRKEYDLITIGRNLKYLRIINGYSVEEIREYLQLGSVQAVYKYERGKGLPQADVLLALMELYGVSASELVEPLLPFVFHKNCFSVGNENRGVEISGKKSHLRILMQYYSGITNTQSSSIAC